MKKLVLIAVIIISSLQIMAQELTQGIWNTGEENTLIETYQKDGMWYGKIISSDNSKAKIGKDILQSFSKKDDRWKGKLFAARKGKLVDATIVPTGNELKITVSAGMFKKKLKWQKVEELEKYQILISYPGINGHLRMGHDDLFS